MTGSAPSVAAARALPHTPALAIVGPTASGKSALALALATSVPGVELISVDSMQAYRGMDIGTAKPSAAERARVAHHGLDLLDPGEELTVVRYLHAYRAALAGIEARRNLAVLVGGTGLYLRATIDGLEPPGQWPAVRAELDAVTDTAALHRRLVDADPAAATKIDPGNRRRIVRALEVCIGSGSRFSSFGPGLDVYAPSAVRQIGLRWPRAALAERIAHRYAAMLAAGFLVEVEALRRRPGGLSRTARQALGYRELLDHLEGRCSLDAAIEQAVIRTRRFATRQERWFRRDPRIKWVDVEGDPLAALPFVLGALPACV